MRIIAKRTLIEFWEKNPANSDVKGQLEAWYKEAKLATWRNPAGVKEKYRNASIIRKNRVVFNICGNKYRLVVKINYAAQIIFIRFIGTHKEYDIIKVEEI